MVKTKIIGILIFALLSIGSAFFLKAKLDQIEDLKKENERHANNEIAYKGILNGVVNENRVLRFTVDDLKDSKDSLINYIEKERKSRKSPKTKPGSTTAVAATVLHDTVEVFIDNPVDFKLDTTIIYNKFTSSEIKIEKKSLISSISVNNIVDLYVYPKRVYVNTYDNKWKRLCKLDWRKKTVYEYTINNSNDLIDIIDKRVYTVE